MARQPRTIAELLTAHIEQDDKRFGAIMDKLAPFDNLAKIAASVRRWFVGAVTGLAIALTALAVQNWLLHQQTVATTAQATTTVKNTITPAEQAILNKLNQIQKNQ